MGAVGGGDFSAADALPDDRLKLFCHGRKILLADAQAIDMLVASWALLIGCDQILLVEKRSR